VCKEVDGLCLRLHCCAPRLVRTSAGSTPYKGATSPIPLEPLLLLLLLLLLLSSITDNLRLSRDRKSYKIIKGVNIAEKKITPLTEAEISIIRSFKLKNSTGYEKVPSRILRHHVPEIRKPLCYVCYSSS